MTPADYSFAESLAQFLFPYFGVRMSFPWASWKQPLLGVYIVKWFLLITPMAAIVGSACALFLWSLEQVTQIRFDQPWLLYGLPLAGAFISFLYIRFGHVAEGGNNLLMDTIHDHEQSDSSMVVPGRMAPLILIATIITHLFGGSAGREGTAVQMGGSIASVIGRRIHLNRVDMRVLLMAGISAGFSGVFGTPLTGTVFAMEVLSIGRISYDALLPCLMAAIISNWVTIAWGSHHTHYVLAASTLESSSVLSWLLVAKIIIAAIGFGLASVLFAELTHGIGHLSKRLIKNPYIRPVIGGVIIILLVYLVGTRDYLGLSVQASSPNAITLSSAFQTGGVSTWSWLYKLLFTSITLGTGFKGGEVTPLFFIGASLGNVLGQLLGAPSDLFAALGFVAVFAGATNTPLACTLMGIELFGSEYTLYFAIASFIAYLFSGHSGIYLSQRIGTPKITSVQFPLHTSLRAERESRPRWEVFLVHKIPARKSHPNPPAHDGNPFMSDSYLINNHEIGQVHIYMTSGEHGKNTATGLKRLLGNPPLYLEIIKAAKADGLLNATAHHTYDGYVSNRKIQADNLEVPNPSINLCVELIGSRAALEQFCRTHGSLLQNKVIVFNALEYWQIDLHDRKKLKAQNKHR